MRGAFGVGLERLVNNIMGEYVQIDRSIKDEVDWTSQKFTKSQAWIDLILLANTEPEEIWAGKEFITIEAGSFITSETKLMKRWKWGNTKIRSFLQTLEKQGDIKREIKCNQSVITIENYMVCSNHQTNSKAKTKQKQSAKKASSKTFNFREMTFYPGDEKLDSALKDYLEVKKQMRKPVTEAVVNALMEKLQKLGRDNDERIQMLKDATSGGWSTVFEPKRERKSFSSNDFMNAFDWGGNNDSSGSTGAFNGHF